MRDSRIYHLASEQVAERQKTTGVLQRLPHLSIFTMQTQLRGGDATCIAEGLSTLLQTIEWVGGNASHRRGSCTGEYFAQFSDILDTFGFRWQGIFDTTIVKITKHGG